MDSLFKVFPQILALPCKDPDMSIILPHVMDFLKRLAWDAEFGVFFDANVSRALKFSVFLHCNSKLTNLISENHHQKLQSLACETHECDV